MKLQASIGGRTWDLEIRDGANGRVTVRADDREIEVDAREIHPGVYSLLVGAESYEVRIRTDPQEDEGETVTRVSLYDDEYVVTLRDPRGSYRAKGAAGSGRGAQKLTAPMPGKVIRIEVAEGEPVKAGQGLLVMEAMKMENELKADRDGTVARLAVSEGSSVEKGALLCIVEAEQ